MRYRLFVSAAVLRFTAHAVLVLEFPPPPFCKLPGIFLLICHTLVTVYPARFTYNKLFQYQEITSQWLQCNTFITVIVFYFVHAPIAKKGG